MYSRVRDFRVGSVQVSLFSIPRDVVLADWKLRLFPGGNGDIRWDDLGSWSTSSGSLFSSILLWWMKLDLSSLLFVGWLILACVGWLRTS